MQGNPPTVSWRLSDKSNPLQSKDSNNLKKADIAHLTVTHKAAGGAEIVIHCWKPLSLKKRGFVHTGQVVTESHDLFLDGRDVTLNAKLLSQGHD